jgi:hypothetical protein
VLATSFVRTQTWHWHDVCTPYNYYFALTLKFSIAASAEVQSIFCPHALHVLHLCLTPPSVLLPPRNVPLTQFESPISQRAEHVLVDSFGYFDQSSYNYSTTIHCFTHPYLQHTTTTAFLTHIVSTCLQKLVANPSLARLLVANQPSLNLALQKLVSNSHSVVCIVFSRRATTFNVSVLVLQVSGILVIISLSFNKHDIFA